MITDGFRFFPGRLDADAQAALAEGVVARTAEAPFYRPVTPGGRPMSVMMTNFGPLGWVSGPAGYAYSPRHPLTGRPWPSIPPALLELWAEASGGGPPPDACLVNFYGQGARMSLHQDRDEADFRHPVVSISLGDQALFRIGGLTRGAPTASLRLSSGDVMVLAGEARLAFHGVDRIQYRSSSLLRDGGRINLTLRRARL